jgi:hypothetical protein
VKPPLASVGLIALTLSAYGSGVVPRHQGADAGRAPVPVASDALPRHEFYFTRAIYSGYGRGGYRGSWSTDYPKADQQFLVGLRRLTNIDAYDLDHAVRLDDPAINRFPFLYTLEVGYMYLTEPEVLGLRRYLLAGGFLMVDDFHGTGEWYNFEEQMGRVLPEHKIVEIPLDHPLFNSVYRLKEVVQVPVVGSGCRGGPTWERDGYTAHVRGIFDEHDRLMVAINWNTDLGDAWEWAELPCYPLKYSTYAWEVGINTIIYAMSH